MATTAGLTGTSERAPAVEYARLEERILARDRIDAGLVLYGLLRPRSCGRPCGSTHRTPHVPYHQRLDDGVVKFVNNDHCLLSDPLEAYRRFAEAFDLDGR